MQVKRADAMGMCFGVRDALAAMQQVQDPSQVTIHGELVHNGMVLQQLAQLGFHQSNERHRSVPATPTVLITAHGVSHRERQKLLSAGKSLIDTTCPLVHKAHDAAQLLMREGRRVVVIGRPDHVEVRGIVEDLHNAVVVASAEEVTTYPDAALGVVCQTTTLSEQVDAIMLLIRKKNPHADIRLIDTVCNPTKARITALAALLPEIDALVVVGGRDSNNTRQLVQRGERHGVATLHVEHAGELDEQWLQGREVVGLTAGTSTLPETIDAVHERLLRLASRVVQRSS